MNELPPVLTPELAASLLECEPKTIEERLRAGDLPGLKFGVGWVLPTQAFLARVNELALQEMRDRALQRAPKAPTLVAVQGGVEPARPGRQRSAANF